MTEPTFLVPLTGAQWDLISVAVSLYVEGLDERAEDLNGLKDGGHIDDAEWTETMASLDAEAALHKTLDEAWEQRQVRDA